MDLIGPYSLLTYVEYNLSFYPHTCMRLAFLQYVWLGVFT